MKANKHIGIITIIDNKNYGNRLQNYAMCKLIQDFGFQPFTIFHSKYNRQEYFKQLLRKILFRSKIIIWIRNLIKQDKYECDYHLEKLSYLKEKAFIEFNKKYIPMSKYRIYGNKCQKNISMYFDFFVSGSDQIWNPNFNISKEIAYLQFAPQEKRNAIAASFGIDMIQEEFQKVLSSYLSEMHYISVREQCGCEIVRSLTGAKCDCIPDPTMLIDKKIWDELISKDDISLPEHYVLTYILGEVTSDFEIFIQNYALKVGLEVIRMNDLRFEDIYIWSPKTFVKAIANCDMFITDSFHGCVFSILYHKQFLVLRRHDIHKNMFSRISNLLKTFELENRIVESEGDMPQVISEYDFSRIDDILYMQRKAAKDQLKLKVFEAKK